MFLILFLRNIDSVKANDGKVKTHHDDFPRWMYPLGQAYNPEKEEIGLFQGHFVIRVSVLIMT